MDGRRRDGKQLGQGCGGITGTTGRGSSTIATIALTSAAIVLVASLAYDTLLPDGGGFAVVVLFGSSLVAGLLTRPDRLDEAIVGFAFGMLLTTAAATVVPAGWSVGADPLTTFLALTLVGGIGYLLASILARRVDDGRAGDRRDRHVRDRQEPAESI